MTGRSDLPMSGCAGREHESFLGFLCRASLDKQRTPLTEATRYPAGSERRFQSHMSWTGVHLKSFLEDIHSGDDRPKQTTFWNSGGAGRA